MTLRILVYPDRAKVSNAYINELTTDFDGLAFIDWSPFRALRSSVDVIHVHWPETVWNLESTSRSVARGLIFLLLLRLARRRGTRVVSTIHNLRPHDNHHPSIDAWFTARFDALVDRFQVLSPMTFSTAKDRIGGTPTDVVLHGHYRSTYSPLPTAKGPPFRLLHFGAIRRYKNTTLLIECFRALPSDNWQLLIAGSTPDPEYRLEVERLAAGDPRITLKLGHVDDAELPELFAQCHLFATPFASIENSGSVMLALSLGLPAIAPSLGNLPELRDNVGDGWLRLFDGPFSTAVLSDALDWGMRTPRSVEPDLSRYEWQRIRSDLRQSYRGALHPGSADTIAQR